MAAWMVENRDALLPPRKIGEGKPSRSQLPKFPSRFHQRRIFAGADPDAQLPILYRGLAYFEALILENRKCGNVIGVLHFSTFFRAAAAGHQERLGGVKMAVKAPPTQRNAAFGFASIRCVH